MNILKLFIYLGPCDDVSEWRRIKTKEYHPPFLVQQKPTQGENYANQHCEVKNRATYQPDDESTAGTIQQTKICSKLPFLNKEVNTYIGRFLNVQKQFINYRSCQMAIQFNTHHNKRYRSQAPEHRATEHVQIHFIAYNSHASHLVITTDDVQQICEYMLQFSSFIDMFHDWEGIWFHSDGMQKSG